MGSFLGKTGHSLEGVLWAVSDDSGRGGNKPKNWTGSGEWGGLGTGDVGVWSNLEAVPGWKKKTFS